MRREFFRVEIEGTSHGQGITTTITDCPANIFIDEDFLQQELTRRRPGQQFTTERQEDDEFVLRSGVSKDGYTNGSNVEIFVPNKGQHSSAYNKLQGILRPGHGITMQMLKAKEKNADIEVSGGGQASARLTIGNVAAGAIAQLALDQMLDSGHIEVISCLERLGRDIGISIDSDYQITEEDIYDSKVRCPDPNTSKEMESKLEDLIQQGDSIGGTVYCRVSNYPGGVGERPGRSLKSRIMGEMGNINAVTGMVIGDELSHHALGSDNIDEITGYSATDLYTKTNHSGGILGGISTGGQPIESRVFFKPTSSIRRTVNTVDMNNDGRTITLGSEDRHDPCVAIRGAEVVKGSMRIVLLQAWLAENY